MIGQTGTRRLLLTASVLACATACSNGSAQDDGGPNGGYTKIDDMEGDGGVIAWTPPAGLAPGVWYAATDCTAAGDILPPPAFVTSGVVTFSDWSFGTLPAPHDTFPGVVSTHAARLRTTSPLVGVWGANMGLLFAQAPSLGVEVVQPPDGGAQACPSFVGDDAGVDLSAYSGITFWAMGDPAGARTIQVQFQDRNTDPRGGICNYTDSNSPDYCYNGFAVAIGLTDTFTRYTIDFSSLRQDPTWGYRPDPDVFDVHDVYELQFQIVAPTCYQTQKCVGGSPPPVTFDFWIDDLYFVNK
jgi:hypothetical protein